MARKRFQSKKRQSISKGAKLILWIQRFGTTKLTKFRLDITSLIVLTLLVYSLGVSKNLYSKLVNEDYDEYYANGGEASASLSSFPGFVVSEIGQASLISENSVAFDEKIEVSTCDLGDNTSFEVNTWVVEVSPKERKSYSAMCREGLPISSYRLWFPKDYTDQRITDIHVDGDIASFNYVESQNEIRNANDNPLSYIEVTPTEVITSGKLTFQIQYVWHNAVRPVVTPFLYPFNLKQFSFFFPSRTAQYYRGSYLKVILPSDDHLYRHRISAVTEHESTDYISNFEISPGDRAYVTNNFLSKEDQREVAYVQGYSGLYFHEFMFGPDFKKVAPFLVAPIVIIMLYGLILREFVSKNFVSVLWNGSWLLFIYSIFIILPTIYMLWKALSLMTYTWYVQEFVNFQRTLLPHLVYGIIIGPILLWLIRGQSVNKLVGKKLGQYWPGKQEVEGDINRGDYVQLYLPLFFSVLLSIWIGSSQLDRPAVITLFDSYYIFLFTLLVLALIYDLRVGVFKQ
jgi:hypothetical protein